VNSQVKSKKSLLPCFILAVEAESNLPYILGSVCLRTVYFERHTYP